jgi:hypothetical protein
MTHKLMKLTLAATLFAGAMAVTITTIPTAADARGGFYSTVIFTLFSKVDDTKKL